VPARIESTFPSNYSGTIVTIPGPEQIILASPARRLSFWHLKNSKPRPGFSSLRVRLVGLVFLTMAAFAAALLFPRVPWITFVIGLLGFVAAWFAGEWCVVRQLGRLVEAGQRLGSGDLSARTGLADEPGEIGKLARSFDTMAASLEQRVKEREQAEQHSLSRALQQTAVAALGQFALNSGEFAALLNQAVMLVSQALEVEFSRVLELLPKGESMLVRAGVGWRKGVVGLAVVNAGRGSQAGYTLSSGEPVVINDLRTETRFQSEPLLVEDGVISGVSVAIGTQNRTYGVLGAYSRHQRNFTSDEIQFLLAVATALAVAVDRRRAETELKKLAEFTQLNPNPTMELAADGTISYFNDAALKLALSVGRQHPREVLPPDIEKIVQNCLTTGQSRSQMESRLDGRVLSWSLHPVAVNQVVHAYVADITDRLNLEAQLRQSQKMDSIGQLAAGVAHDFNNMLTVIQGHAGMLMSRRTLPPELKDSVQAVHFAAERAAGLTRQLLLFSRQSLLQPRLLDLREIVQDMSKMLKRLLGETIALEFSPPAEIALVYGDAGMIEQVLLNLAVNARDAMQFGGKLIISLQPLTVDEPYVKMHPEARTGAFVLLRVTDTGSGMDPTTLSRIFEPFFTTKEVGKGTGLGLATVYGIIKLHEGWIEVMSEVGKGTTFSIFLPASKEVAQKSKKAEALVAPVRGGTETILLVEDESSVLKMGRIILQDLGYQVLEAANGVEALEAWQNRKGSVHLLLTDMVMPDEMSGIDLAQKLLTQQPGLKILFTSGYSVGDLDTDFIRQGGGSFLQKPYTRFTLAKAVRESLDKSSSSPAPAPEPAKP
jgi:signal transduction histidine kinase/ActR/RegA family two-component response regulator